MYAIVTGIRTLDNLFIKIDHSVPSINVSTMPFNTLGYISHAYFKSGGEFYYIVNSQSVVDSYLAQLFV